MSLPSFQKLGLLWSFLPPECPLTGYLDRYQLRWRNGLPIALNDGPSTCKKDRLGPGLHPL